jgi:hypothetical protein
VSREEEYSRSLSFKFRDKRRRKLPVCRLEKLKMWDAQTSHHGQVVQIVFWRKTSRQTHQIRLVYTTDNFSKRLGPYITHSPVALPIHPIQGKRRERLHDVLPIKIHCRVIWDRNWRCLGLSWEMHGFCSVAKKTSTCTPLLFVKILNKIIARISWQNIKKISIGIYFLHANLFMKKPLNNPYTTNK